MAHGSSSTIGVLISSMACGSSPIIGVLIRSMAQVQVLP
jgi:hypothetical protein